MLGMHRSGTSCLTGSLQEAGLSLGDCHTWNHHNIKGNRENQKFVDLHDSILQDNGGSWDLPPKKIIWSARHRQRALELLAEHSHEDIFGFKDPRTLLLVDGWKVLVPGLEFVGIFRRPDAVARSLEKRSAMARDQALKLWYNYNARLYRQYRSRPFPLLCFDDDERQLLRNLSAVAVNLGLQALAGDSTFFSSQLRTAPPGEDAGPLPWKIRRLHRKLQKSCFENI